MDVHHRWRFLCRAAAVPPTENDGDANNQQNRRSPASRSAFDCRRWKSRENFFVPARRCRQLAEGSFFAASARLPPQSHVRPVTAKIPQEPPRELPQRRPHDVDLPRLQAPADGRVEATAGASTDPSRPPRLSHPADENQTNQRHELHGGLCKKIGARWQRPSTPNSRSSPSAKLKKEKKKTFFLQSFLKHFVFNFEFTQKTFHSTSLTVAQFFFSNKLKFFNKNLHSGLNLVRSCRFFFFGWKPKRKKIKLCKSHKVLFGASGDAKF